MESRCEVRISTYAIQLSSYLGKIHLLRSFMNFLKKSSQRQAKQKIQLDKKIQLNLLKLVK